MEILERARKSLGNGRKLPIRRTASPGSGASSSSAWSGSKSARRRRSIGLRSSARWRPSGRRVLGALHVQRVAASAWRPVGRPMGSGKKPAAAAAARLDGALQAGEDISMSTPQPAPAPVAKNRAWTTAEKSFALGMLPICGDNLARTINWLHDNRYSVCGSHQGQQWERVMAQLQAQ